MLSLLIIFSFWVAITLVIVVPLILTFQQNDNKTYVRVRKWDSSWTTWTALF